jgi:hypothetical protein
MTIGPSECHLRPTGQHYQAWTGEGGFEYREVLAGEVVAEGVAGCEGYGSSSIERPHFIVRTVRGQTTGAACTVHTVGRAGIEAVLGRPLLWCPDCGTDLR